MGLSKRYRLGNYIARSTKNNRDLTYGTDLIVGVTSEGKFSEPKGNVDGVNLKPYKIVNNGDFVYNPSRLNLGSIAYRTEGLCIVSHLYVIFHLNELGKKKILPEYLFMYLRRQEFYREVEFRNFGSQRPEFSYNDMKKIYLPIPTIEAQQKAVDIYNGLKENLAAYESGLEDLKLTCDGVIEDLRRTNVSKEIGEYIVRHDVRNSDNKISNVMGVSVLKQFREPTSKVNRNNLSNYKIVKPRQIAFVQTTNNEKVFAYAFNDIGEDIVVSSVDEVFSINEKSLHPEYLCMWFNRTEFDRYARFNSWGTARETFVWDDLIKVKIPIPDMHVQKSIADIYSCYMERKRIAEGLKKQLNNICPILIQGAIMAGD